MGYSAKAVANYFLEQYEDTKISPLKVQKLVYIAHGWHWAFHNESLVDDEHAEAWEYGPIFASLFHEFKIFGREPIKGLASEIYIGKYGKTVTHTPKIPLDDDRTCRFLDKVWEQYGGHSASTLSSMCHHTDPWFKARVGDSKKKNVHIDDGEIKKYYECKLEQNKNRQQESNDDYGNLGEESTEGHEGDFSRKDEYACLDAEHRRQLSNATIEAVKKMGLRVKRLRLLGEALSELATNFALGCMGFAITIGAVIMGLFVAAVMVGYVWFEGGSWVWDLWTDWIDEATSADIGGTGKA